MCDSVHRIIFQQKISNSVRKYSTTKMQDSSEITDNLKRIFQASIEAVQPKNLFSPANICVNSENTAISLNFNENRINIDISKNKRCHLVGFGKAVYGMTNELSKVLGNRLKSGLISIPINTKEKFPDIHLPQMIRVFEGAKNNLPDKLAMTAAQEITNFVRTLGNDDILFVLISGGGSALLPLPCNGITLDEKLRIIKSLTAKGASIDDLNRVRIDLSCTKGGKLGAMAKNASAVISLIISDIIDDPLHLIASGPTVCYQTAEDKRSIDVLQQYGLWNDLSENLKSIIEKNAAANENSQCDNIHNFIIANNEVAVNHALNTITQQNQIGLIMSTRMQGDVSDISRFYFHLSQNIQRFKNHHINESEFLASLSQLQEGLAMRHNFLENIVEAVQRMRYNGSDLYVIAAGEPTVKVIGQGLGGRNQELALRFSLLCSQDASLKDILLLSAGTDGIDGKVYFKRTNFRSIISILLKEFSIVFHVFLYFLGFFFI